MIRAAFCFGALFAVVVVMAQQGDSPLPMLPPDIPKHAEMRVLMMDMKPTGQDAVWRDENGIIHESFNSAIGAGGRKNTCATTWTMQG